MKPLVESDREMARSRQVGTAWQKKADWVVPSMDRLPDFRVVDHLQIFNSQVLYSTYDLHVPINSFGCENNPWTGQYVGGERFDGSTTCSGTAFVKLQVSSCLTKIGTGLKPDLTIT